MYIRSCELVCLVSLGAFGGAMTAQAADLYHAPPAPPPTSYVPPIVPTNTWTGFYAGINGGYGWGSGGDSISYFDGADQSARGQPQGGFGGGQIGYNYQVNSFVFGVETDFQGAGISSSVGGLTAGGVDFTSQQNIDWFGTVRGRVGVAFDRVLVYGTGGFAYGNVSQHANYGGDVFSSNTTQTGYAVGGGVEYKINPAWSLKAEYQYIDLGCDRLTDSLGNATNPLDTTFQTVRAGVNYHFGGGYEPLK